MADSLSQILSDNNKEVRQKILKNTVSQVIVADRLDAVAEFAASIVGSDSIGIAKLTNSPADLPGYDPTKYQRVDAYEEGEYTNWLDESANPLEVTSEDLASGKVQFVGTGGKWDVKIILVDISSKISYTDLDKQPGLNLLDPVLVQFGKVVSATTGEIQTQETATAYSIIDFPVAGLGIITVTGNNPSGSRGWSFMDAGGDVLTRGVTSLYPLTVPVPEDAVTFNAHIATDPETFDNLMIVEGSVEQPYEPYREYIDKVSGDPLMAETLSRGNIIPDPEHDKSAVNREYVEKNAVLLSTVETIDLSTIDGVNLFDKETMVVSGRGLGSGGVSNPLATAGHTDFIKIRPNSSILFNKLSGAPSSGFWYSEPSEDADTISALTIPSGTSGFLTSPSTANFLRINLYNNSTPDVQGRIDAYMIAISEEALPYIPFTNFLKSIAGASFYEKDINQDGYGYIRDILSPFGNFQIKKQEHKNGGTPLIQVGIFGDSWTDRVPAAIYYVREITARLRDKFGNGGAGWYDFGIGSGNQKMQCAEITDITDVRTGTINYVDQSASAKGINVAHAEFENGATITLTIAQNQTTADLHYYAGSGYGTFTYKIGSASAVSVNAAASEGYQVISGLPVSGESTVIITVTSGSCIVLGINFLNDSGIVVHKFGNRGLRAAHYAVIDAENYKAALSNFNLDSATLLIGTNDRTGGVSPGQFKADVQHFISMFKESQPFTDFALIAPSNNKLTAPASPMLDYATKLYECAADNDISFLNLIPLFGETDQILAKSTFYDDVHPTVTGGQMIANYIIDKLLA